MRRAGARDLLPAYKLEVENFLLCRDPERSILQQTADFTRIKVSYLPKIFHLEAPSNHGSCKAGRVDKMASFGHLVAKFQVTEEGDSGTATKKAKENQPPDGPPPSAGQFKLRLQFCAFCLGLGDRRNILRCLWRIGVASNTHLG